MLADETHVALHGDDGTLAGEEQSGAVFRNLVLDLASAGKLLAGPEIGPLALGQIDLVTENAEEQIVQPTEVKIVNERSLLHKRALIAAVVILAVVVLGVIFLLTTDLYNMFS